MKQNWEESEKTKTEENSGGGENKTKTEAKPRTRRSSVQLRPAPPKQEPATFLNVKGGIVSTLFRLQSEGRAESTVRCCGSRLAALSRHVNLIDPGQVASWIGGAALGNGYKKNLVQAYNHFCRVNGLEWVAPRFRCERRMPKIPTAEAVGRIVSAASARYALIFRLLGETGVMPYELSRVELRDIDLDRAVLSVQGFKGHASRAFKLKAETVAMLRVYLAKCIDAQRLFPRSRSIQKTWQRIRREQAEKFQDPSLRTIRLYDLRHYFATMTYHRTKDILYTKQQMGHKRIETTLIYTQLVDFGEDEWTSAVARSPEEACKLVEAGFDYVTDVDGAKIFRKRK